MPTARECRNQPRGSAWNTWQTLQSLAEEGVNILAYQQFLTRRATAPSVSLWQSDKTKGHLDRKRSNYKRTKLRTSACPSIRGSWGVRFSARPKRVSTSNMATVEANPTPMPPS